MKLGAFSISLAVKDLQISKQFYEHLGFALFAGDVEKNYVIMKNGDAIVGLFQGMFENNIITFNPGWDQNAGPVEGYDDIRDLQSEFKSKGIAFQSEVAEDTQGPANFVINDPDGNTLLFDQHI